jgi:hypothetical protein
MSSSLNVYKTDIMKVGLSLPQVTESSNDCRFSAKRVLELKKQIDKNKLTLPRKVEVSFLSTRK